MSTATLTKFIIETLPHEALLLASATQTVIASIETGDILYSVIHEQPVQAPRYSAVLPLLASDGGSGSSSSSTFKGDPSECLVALMGDDKELHIFTVKGVATKNVKVEEIWSSSLPKRLVKMVWEQDDSKTGKVLTTGDRHGDVRSFTIPLDTSEVEMREAKRRRIVASNDENDEEVDEDAIDISNPPLLGHVSMLTDLVLTSFTSTSPQSPENYIITCDRDEHIRISRWGKRRAGHLALRYLLGSSDAIGGLCVIEHELLDVLQKSVTTESARKVCESPVLLSTDSTFLRFWSLHKDTKTSSRKDLVHVLDLKAFIAPYLMVDPKREKDRERLFGKGKVDSKNLQKKLEGTVWANAEDVGGKNIGALKANVESDAVVMTHLSAMHVAEEVYVCFVVEGASALFTIALSRLLSSPTEEAGNHIHALDMGVPIVGRVHQSQEGEHSVWMTCDTRPEMTRGSNQQPGLRLALWDKSDMQWKEDLHSNQLVRKQRSLQTQGTLELAQSLLLYDALTMLPKQEFERTTLMEETISPNGLTRGGLSCFKKTGNAKGSNVSGANKESSERVTGKKVKAREEMLKRIEQALTGDE